MEETNASEQIWSQMVKYPHHGSPSDMTIIKWKALFNESEQREIAQLDSDYAGLRKSIGRILKRIRETRTSSHSQLIHYVEDSVKDTINLVYDTATIYEYVFEINPEDQSDSPSFGSSWLAPKNDYVSYISGILSDRTAYEFLKGYFLHRIRTSVASIKTLKTRLTRLAVSIEAEKALPVIPQPINFIKDNKLPSTDDDEHKRVRLPLSMAEDLADRLDLMDKEMAQILTISIRTYHRLKQNGLLNPVASERLIMLKDLADYGLEVFENQDSFNQWLRLPLQELSNNSPLNSLGTVIGFSQVKTLLSRIDYGVYS